MTSDREDLDDLDVMLEAMCEATNLISLARRSACQAVLGEDEYYKEVKKVGAYMREAASLLEDGSHGLG